MDAVAAQFEVYALYSILAVATAGLLYAILLAFQILKENKGNEKMQKIAKAIQVGANAYLKRQFKTVALLIIVLSIALYFTANSPQIGLGRSLAFLMGSIFSATVGYIGMNMAVRGNVRVASAAGKSFGDALRIAYRTGTITGMLTDGLGLLGGTLIFMVYGDLAYEVLLGFGFGGCLLALFMRVGGGIYTKAADVGADMVGKVEKNIPEDDPRNPAVIADLVGDNVGDCAGMAADIFESYEVTIVSAMILGYAAFGHKGVIFPLMVRAMGVLGSIIGTYAVRARKEMESAMRAITRGFTLSAAISIIGFFSLAYFYMNDIGASFELLGIQIPKVFLATLAGIVLAISVNVLTEYFTSKRKSPVKEIVKSAQTGPATTILSGLSIGYESTVWAILVIAGAIFASIAIFGSNTLYASYGVALCGVGMLTLTGNNISMDAFGPISDNANGIGEMAGLEGEARDVLADLDSVGNTTKAITKGIAIGSAVIAAVSLFGSYVESTKLPAIAVSNPYVFIGLLVGGAVPFLFSSITISAVERAASLIVNEVRRQFNSIPGLMEGKTEPDYAACVSICTKAAQRELLVLGVLAILTPIIVGFLLHEEALGGFLAGIILTGQLLAVLMATAGAAWDNAKKAIEGGLLGGKGSDAHKASVIGDTVGDPLKDTAGPGLNPMIKVINLVSLIIAPIVVANKVLTLPVVLAVVAMVAAIAAALWLSKKGFVSTSEQDA